MNIPNNLKYTKTDEWLKIEGNVGIVGISDYAQQQLSDIVYVGFNYEKDKSFKQNDALATVESVKAAAEVNAPVSGKIIEANLSLTDSPELLNKDPYEKGWLFKIEITDPESVKTLMDAQTYQKHCEDRGH